MQTINPLNKSLLLPAAVPDSFSLLFELQPIVSFNSGNVAGHEMLYRGITPDSWSQIDRAVLTYLMKNSLIAESLYVNLSNESLLSLPIADFIEAAQMNSIYFELSESVVHTDTYDKIVEKVNALTAAGVQVAVDDFGCGFDGLYRAHSLDKVQVIKIDRTFMKLAARKKDAAEALLSLLTNWKKANILTIAEGIETAADYEFAQQININMGQGFYIDAMVIAATKAALPTCDVFTNMRRSSTQFVTSLFASK